jgi:release factor glutamine methyltransferase
MNIHASLHEAAAALKKTINTDESRLEAQLLLEHTLKVNHAWLIAHAENELDSRDQLQFHELIQRRMTGEPIAYIIGEREFYGLTLKVTPNTLIPRPDTETLVDTALSLIPKNAPKTILDLGTGTGAIALVIAKHRPLSQLTAVDASYEALKVAQENAQHLTIPNVHFLQSNWFEHLLNQTFDLVISNPPYIEESDPHLNQGDLRFEPLSALASGNDGLNDIRHIISHVKKHLNPHGWVLIEHGYNQSSRVADLMRLAEFNLIQHVNDLAGIERVTMAQM